MKILLDSTDETITVDGVKISLFLLRALANPDPKRLYRLVREGDVVTVTAINARAELEAE